MREVISGFSPIYEISQKATVTGRRPIKVVLHEIFPDETKYQGNGVSWNENFTIQNAGSVVGMSIVAEFLGEDRDIPYGHGLTGVIDDMPVFEDATMVGHFDKAYVDDVEIDGEMKRVFVAEGTLDEMRYPKFVAWLKENLSNGTVKGSVEIVGKPENDGRIIYSDGWKETGRVPMIYDYSGYAILSVHPADESAIVMELNNKTKKEECRMDEQTRNEIVNAVSTELCNKWDAYYAQVAQKEAEITQLKADMEAKEAEITQLRADFEKENADRMAAEAGLTEANSRAESATQELAEANSKIAELENAAANAELNEALKGYTEEQQAVAKDMIDAFRNDPKSVEINSIIGAICTKIVKDAKESRTSEQNSAIDVFSLIDVKDDDDDGEVNVY